MMNICIINSDFKLGGQQKAVITVSELLSGKNNEIELYSFYPSTPFFDLKGKKFTIDSSLDDLNYYDKVKRKIERKFFYNKGNAMPAREFSKRLSNFIFFLKDKKIDIVILSGGFLTSFSKIIKNELPDIRIIAWQHSNAEIYLNKYFSAIKKEYESGLKNSDAIVCLTKHDESIFKKYNNNTFAIPNALTIDSNGLISSVDNYKILFVARYDIYTKGIDLLLDIMLLLPNEITLEFAGSGNSKQIKAVKKLIKERHLEKRVTLNGALDKEELKSFYRNGSIFLSTSRWEGFGLALIEAMEFGLPVVAFATVGSREIIGENEHGIIIENQNINQMASTINNLIYNEETKRKFRLKSKNRANDFATEKIKEKWEDVIKKIYN